MKKLKILVLVLTNIYHCLIVKENLYFYNSLISNIFLHLKWMVKNVMTFAFLQMKIIALQVAIKVKYLFGIWENDKLSTVLVTLELLKSIAWAMQIINLLLEAKLEWFITFKIQIILLIHLSIQTLWI